MATDPDMVLRQGFAALDRLAEGCASLGLAVSGGGDSVALMHLAARWAADRGRRVAVATVDHGLRPDSRAEAQQVGRDAAALGLPHEILPWSGPEGGNLMADARQARLRLLADWARRQGLDAVALGHTRDDVAETLLMRLSRGAGIDGLAAMRDRRVAEGVVWLRPLLQIGRDDLRVWLREIGADWIEDPTNHDPRFDRARVRRAMAELGLEPAQLALSAAHLAEAREALNDSLRPHLDRAQLRAGAVLLDRAAFDAAPSESRRRLVIAAVRFITAAAYPPRRAAVEAALSAVAEGKRATLDGAVLDPGAALLVHREPAAAGGAALHGGIWDNRWQISGLRDGDRVLAPAPDPAPGDWRGAGLTHLEAQALPVIRRGDALLSPVLRPVDGLTAEPIRGKLELAGLLLGH